MRHNPGRGIMPEFVAPGREVSLDRVERVWPRQSDRVSARRVMRAVAAVDDADRDRVEEGLHPGRKCANRLGVRRLGIVMRWQPLDLRGVEHVVPLHEADRLLGRLTGLAIGVGLARRTVEHAERAALALAHMGAEFERLTEGHPVGAGVTAALGDRPEEEGIDPRIGDTVVAQRPRAGRGPGFEPRGRAGRDLFEDQVGDDLRDVGFGMTGHWAGPSWAGSSERSEAALDQVRRSVRPCGMRQATRSAKAMRMPARIAASSPSRIACARTAAS
jgi:hypothetical protein